VPTPAEAQPTEVVPTPAEAPPTEVVPTEAVLAPAATQAAVVPAPAVAPVAVVAVPAVAATPSAPTRRKRDRVLGTVGQVFGIVGLVVCLLLVVGVVVGRGWAVGAVDDVSATIDAEIAKADPLLSQAGAKLGEVSGRVSAVGDLAAAVAANPSPGGDAASGIRTVLGTVSEKYQALRSQYADVRESVVSIIGRLQTLDRIVPGLSIPQGPVDALAALDARLQEFDSSVNGLLTIDPGNGPVNKAAAAISQGASDINARLGALQNGIVDVQGRVSTLRAKISDATGTIKLGITLGSIGTILLLLYLALLNWVLFRHSGEIRRKTSAA
jgi:hypothetical protein